MTAELTQRPLFSPFRNNLLFTEHYLRERVPEGQHWASARADARAALERIQERFDEARLKQLDEAQLETEWVQWVFSAVLGHHFAVQVKVEYRDGGHRRPDYVFSDSAANKDAITNEIYAAGSIPGAVALADAKKWGVPFDRASGNSRTPAQQIKEYLEYSELPWGILTDGNEWRLYERSGARYNRYYSVQMNELIPQGEISAEDVERFLYFYVFFRREAFVSGWLDEVLKGSATYAENLRDSLEEQVFVALEGIAQGFLEYRRNGLPNPPDAETLKVIYDESLVLLYRLLFIFYGESREVLPVQNTYYESRSVQAVVKEARKLGWRTLSADDSTLYYMLGDLFFLIDKGDDRFGLPAYNGKLFSNDDHPFLNEKVVGNKYLAPAIEQLATVEATRDKKKRRVSVDYQDLEVAHLGTIYEKLLEYELAYTDRPLRISGKDETYKPTTDADKADKQAGQVYLRTGNNQRKVTGSYYTPDYIVRFIVEKTVGPLLDDLLPQYATLQADSGEWDVNDAAGLRDAVLALNILDPATGSGHFVVDVVVYMADWLTERGLALPELVDEPDETSYWMRRIAESCVYAVDINPLAVELAKLSLWLKTLARDKPLSFLDHHVRVGNSLVGASIFEISDDLDEARRRKKREREARKAAAAGQKSLFTEAHFTEGVGFAVEQMQAIENTVSTHVDDVKRQEGYYAQLTQRLSRYRQAADVWTARAFGLDITQEQWKSVRALSTNGTPSPEVTRLVERAEQIAGEHRFFHWELAFPEVFFTADGQPKEGSGFDAVIGNPPYVRQERIKPIKPFLQGQYDVYSGTADLYLYFYERGIEFLRDEGKLGYITSGTYMNSNSAKSFRQYIHDHAGMEWVANFGENQPFKGAEMVYPTIAVMRRGDPDDTFRNLFIEDALPFAELDEAIESGAWVDSLSNVTGNDEWRFQSQKLTVLYSKVVANRTRLGDGFPNAIYRGVVTGLNDAFIIDNATKYRLENEHPSSKGLIKPLLRGQDLRPWYQQDSGKFLILAYQGVAIDDFPAVKRHLAHYRAQLEPMPPDHNGAWEGRSSGKYQWYELQTPASQNYIEMCESIKICWPDISKRPRFSTNTGAYLNNTAYMVPASFGYLVSLLQSRVMWFALSQLATPLRLRAGLWQYRLFKQYIKRLPIPELTPAQERDLAELAETITALARERYALHENVRRDLIDDVAGGDGEISTRVRLYEWWQYDPQRDFAAFNEELKRRFEKALEVGDPRRDRWRKHLADRRGEHQRLTDEIITHETRLNAIVYDAFDLTPDERHLIETATKYLYGAV